jgi:hypothetical protein
VLVLRGVTRAAFQHIRIETSKKHNEFKPVPVPVAILLDAQSAQELVNKRQAEAVEESALEGAIRCSGCGCVWVRGPNGHGRVLGTLRHVGRNYEWRSRYKR